MVVGWTSHVRTAHRVLNARHGSAQRGPRNRGDGAMKIGGKPKHRAESGLGRAKEELGDATNDPELQEEGKREQSEADLKQAGDKVKDAFRK
ncbi:MAG TPA: CsbD family protein [Nocardioidaceae bacterium]|nr:CsbD family protein [Nocardioidaceae bacterium]